jgi:tetratricopeptide (TPR) repeat protein
MANRGRVAQAEAAAREVLEQMQKLQILPIEQATRVGLSVVLLVKGDADGALEHALAVARAPFGWGPIQNDARTVAARVLLDKRRAEEALAFTSEALAKFELGITMTQPMLRLTHAEALEALGRQDEARAAFDDAHRVMREKAAALDTERRAQFLAWEWNQRLARRFA